MIPGKGMTLLLGTDSRLKRNCRRSSSQIMIKYRIIVSNTSDKKPLVPFKRPNEEGYKQFVLVRNIAGCHFSEGSRVKIRRGHKRGYVVKIHRKEEDVNWDNNKPMFIEVKFDDGTSYMCHHSQLKRSK